MERRRPRREEARITGFPAMVWSVAFTLDSRAVAANRANQWLQLWDVTEPKTPRERSFPFNGTRTRGIAFSPNGRIMSTVSADYAVQFTDVTDLNRPRHLSTITGHKDDVFSVSFSPDIRRIATADNGGTVGMWDVTKADNPVLAATLNYQGMVFREPSVATIAVWSSAWG